MAKKTNPTGIRFDLEKVAFIKQREKLSSNQQVVDFLLNSYWWQWKIPIPTAKESPPLALKTETQRLPQPELIMPQKALKSFEQYREAKRECETIEQWEALKSEIEEASNLSFKQKQLLKSTNV